MYSLPQSYNQTSKCKRCISSNAYLKDKQEGASRVFIAIDEKLYAFYNIRLGNKLVKQLFPDKIFLNKDDYHDPLKNIEELLFSL